MKDSVHNLELQVFIHQGPGSFLSLLLLVPVASESICDDRLDLLFEAPAADCRLAEVPEYNAAPLRQARLLQPAGCLIHIIL